MTSSAPCGSYTPGANTNGSPLRSSRSRVAGSVQRDAGTVRPGGRSGVSASLVVMVDLAELGAHALRLLRPHRVLGLADAQDRLVFPLRAAVVEVVHDVHETGTLRAAAPIRQIVCLDTNDQVCL